MFYLWTQFVTNLNHLKCTFVIYSVFHFSIDPQLYVSISMITVKAFLICSNKKEYFSIWFKTTRKSTHFNPNKTLNYIQPIVNHYKYY